MESLAVITGGYSGIGFEMAKGLMKANPKMQVLITSRMEKNGLDAKATLMQSTSRNNIDVFAPLDQCDAAQVESLREYLETKYPKGIDILVNNAGIKMNVELPMAEEAEVVKVNYFGLTRVTDVLSHMIRQNGKIINIASQLGIKAYQATIDSTESREAFSLASSRADLDAVMSDYIRTAVNKGPDCFAEKGYHNCPYCFSKLGVLRFTELLANNSDSMSKNILVVSCCPGWCNTKLATLGAKKTAEEGAQVPLELSRIPVSEHSQNTGHFFVVKGNKDWRGHRSF